MTVHDATIRREGSKVVLIVNGAATVLPWEAAEEIGRGLIAKARQAEEQEKALGIIADHALLLRAGFPVGLTNRPDMQAEAAHVAQFDRDLRRYLPGGIRSREMIHVPTIIAHSPRRSPDAEV